MKIAKTLHLRRKKRKRKNSMTNSTKKAPKNGPLIVLGDFNARIQEAR